MDSGLFLKATRRLVRGNQLAERNMGSSPAARMQSAIPTGLAVSHDRLDSRRDDVDDVDVVDDVDDDKHRHPFVAPHVILLSPILPQSAGESWHRLSVKSQSDIQLIRGERNEHTWSFRVQKHAGEDEEGRTIPGCAKGICDTHFHISSRESPSFGSVEGCGIKIFPRELKLYAGSLFPRHSHSMDDLRKLVQLTEHSVQIPDMIY
ncbi:predicted protein [Histoplasma capsulatum var. duboisii H88]|uniref:Predicted protein n=2 Tax=Ajellomyces capsulatus TaxID=5037 RepID=F0UVE9_AJEC8|nr:predicted protein [Histoplasma capsulatum H143]EGC49876.1 predicted protein [Histoplasma capsulatum var. duboisii H88]